MLVTLSNKSVLVTVSLDGCTVELLIFGIPHVQRNLGALFVYREENMSKGPK